MTAPARPPRSAKSATSDFIGKSFPSYLLSRLRLRHECCPLSTDDLEDFEADRELHLAQEYQDVAGMFRFAIETERRFYLANKVDVNVKGDSTRPLIEVELTDAWVWDMYRKSRFVPKVRIFSFKDVNVEELPQEDLTDLDKA